MWGFFQIKHLLWLRISRLLTLSQHLWLPRWCSVSFCLTIPAQQDKTPVVWTKGNSHFYKISNQTFTWYVSFLEDKLQSRKQKFTCVHSSWCLGRNDEWPPLHAHTHFHCRHYEFDLRIKKSTNKDCERRICLILNIKIHLRPNQP